MDRYSICDKLKNLRESKNLKQNTVAEYLGISQQCYSRYENGKRELPIRYLKPLSTLYSVSTDYLLGISMNQNDYDCIAQKLCNGVPLKDILEDINALDDENKYLMTEYLTYLKYKQEK